MPTLDRYVTPLKLPMTIDDFWRFPHVPAYRAEYLDGHAVLTYRLRLNMARLRIARRDERTIDGVRFGTMPIATPHEPLARLFVAAFARVPPLDAMPATTRRHAADAALRHTSGGGDGEVYRPACLAATDNESGELIGAAILTKISLRADEWPEPSLPATLLNLTWLFVASPHQRRGIATGLLDRVVNMLAAEGMPWMVSHFADDNAASMLFHWRAGFELVSPTARR